MDEGASSDTVTPDLRDVEVKIGRKTPEGLLRWMREEAPSVRGDARLSAAHELGKETGRKGLDEKIRKLRVEMTHLRSLDVRILQQLLVVHEGIEAVKWLLEERSTLTSRCSSLTSSLYSLGEGPDTSWRGSWSSLQDPHDRLDNVSIGSYLDTLADDLDEYCPSGSESVICSTAEAGGRTAGGPGATVPAAGPAAAAGMRSGTLGAKLIRLGANENESGPEVSGDSGTGGAGEVTGAESTPAKTEGPKRETTVWTKAPEAAKARLGPKAVNGILEKPAAPTGSPTGSPSRSSQSPKLKASKSGKVDLDTCKMNGRRHLEYDTHWRWVQSQEDVTFL